MDLVHTFPDIGCVQVPLYNESIEIFNFLEKALPHGIRFFEHLDHLGKLREVHKTAHHSRWEYILLQCHLFKSLTESLGLSSQATLSNRTTISSYQELLKCWTLLFNFGHLHGTLEAERFWMNLIISEQTLSSNFLSGLPDEESREIARNILSAENYYHLYRLFALFFLEQFRTKSGYSHWPIESWIQIVKEYMKIHPDGSALWKMQRIFRIIRQISYVYLDLYFSASPVRIQPAILVEHLRTVTPSDFFDGDSSIRKLINSIDDVLFESLYASTEVSAYKLAYFETQHSRYKSLIKKNGKKKFSKDRHTLFFQLRNKREADFGGTPKTSDYKHFLRLKFLPEEFWGRNACKYFSETKSLNQQIKTKDVQYFVTPIPYGELEGSLLDVFLKKDSLKTSDASNIFWLTIKYCVECYNYWKSVEWVYNDLISIPISAVFLKIANSLTPPNHYARFGSGLRPEEHDVYFFEKQSEIKQRNNALREAIKDSDLPSYRKKELECTRWLLQQISRTTGFFICSGSNIIIYGPDGNEVAEIDGLIFNVRRRSLRFWLIETKKGASFQAKNRAKRDLEAKYSTVFSEKIKARNTRTRGFRKLKASMAYFESSYKARKLTMDF